MGWDGRFEGITDDIYVKKHLSEKKNQRRIGMFHLWDVWEAHCSHTQLENVWSAFASSLNISMFYRH